MQSDRGRFATFTGTREGTRRLGDRRMASNALGWTGAVIPSVLAVAPQALPPAFAGAPPGASHCCHGGDPRRRGLTACGVELIAQGT